MRPDAGKTVGMLMKKPLYNISQRTLPSVAVSTAFSTMLVTRTERGGSQLGGKGESTWTCQRGIVGENFEED